MKTARKKKNKGGRPRTLTEEILTSIVDSLKGSATIGTALQKIGIPYPTYRSWIVEGKRHTNKNKIPTNKEIYVKFLKETEKAIGEMKTLALKGIFEGDERWQSKAWWLERIFPGEFGCQAREIRILQKEILVLKRQMSEMK